MTEVDIIDTYHGVTKIENQFRVMKGNLEIQPIFVRTRKQVEAHLFICMLSLVIMRLIQNKIIIFKIENNIVDDSQEWFMSLSVDRLVTALDRWGVNLLSLDYYIVND